MVTKLIQIVSKPKAGCQSTAVAMTHPDDEIEDWLDHALQLLTEPELAQVAVLFAPPDLPTVAARPASANHPAHPANMEVSAEVEVDMRHAKETTARWAIRAA